MFLRPLDVKLNSMGSPARLTELLESVCNVNVPQSLLRATEVHPLSCHIITNHRRQTLLLYSHTMSQDSTYILESMLASSSGCRAGLMAVSLACGAVGSR